MAPRPADARDGVRRGHHRDDSADPQIDHRRRCHAAPARGRRRAVRDDRRAGPARRADPARPDQMLGPDQPVPHLRPAHPGLPACAAPAAGVLHPRADRLPGQQAQHRCRRRADSGDVLAVDGGVRLPHPAARVRRHVLSVLADDGGDAAGDPAVPAAEQGRRQAAAAAHPGADAAGRRHRLHDERAVQRRRCAAGQALRAAGGGVQALREPRGPGPRHLDGHRGVRTLPVPSHGAAHLFDHGADVRVRRQPRHRRDVPARQPGRAHHPADPAVRPDQPVVEHAGERAHRPGELRPGLRGAGSEAADHGASRRPPGHDRRGHRRAGDRVRQGVVPLSVRGRGVPGVPGVDRGRRPRAHGLRQRPGRGELPRAGRPADGTGRPFRVGQDDDHPAGAAAVRPRLGDRAHRRPRHPGGDPGVAAGDDRCGQPGGASVP